MTSHAKRLLDQALQLPEHERAEIAAVLIRSLEAVDCENLGDVWDREIARRLAEIDAAEVSLVPWETARRQIFGPLHGSE